MTSKRAGFIFIAVAVGAGACGVSCVSAARDVNGLTKSRLHVIELLGCSALGAGKPLRGVASISDFLDIMKEEVEGAGEQYLCDEWNRPFLVATYDAGGLRGILVVSLGFDETSANDDLRLWIVKPADKNNDIRVSRSWK